MIIAIDGPAGTGKSTIASIIAKKLNVTYLNSGSFYRALTLAMLDAGIQLMKRRRLLISVKNRNLNIRIHILF